MAYIDIIRNVKLLEKSISRLETMGEARPKTVIKLKHALQPIADKPLVSIAEPFSVLHELQRVYGDVKVNIQYTTVHKLDVNKFEKLIYAKIKDKAKQSKGVLVPAPTSNTAKNQTSGLKIWVEQTLKQVEKKKLSLTVEEFEKQFMAQYMQTNTDHDVAGEIVKNLKETDYITTSSETINDDDNVQYNFPSVFTLACMKWILNKYQKLTGTGSPDAWSEHKKPLSTAIRSINSHILKLGKALNGEIDAQMMKDLQRNRINSAVDALHKTRGRSRRASWETRSRSSSRSRSPRSRSTSSFSSTSSRSLSAESHEKESDHLTEDQKRGIVDRLIGQVQGLALDTATFLQNSLASLCQGMEKLAVSDIRLIPHNLTLESIYALLEIGKMGEYLPRTVKALKNAIKPACRIFYLVDFSELLTFPDKSSNYEMDSLKRKLRPRRRIHKVTQIMIGRVTKLRPVSVNPTAPFIPDRKVFTNTKNQTIRYRARNSAHHRYAGAVVSVDTVIDEYFNECRKLVELVRKHSEKQAQYWSSCVVLGDKLQVSAAAGDIYRWLCHDQQDKMQCDGDDNNVKSKTFKNKDQLLQGLAERCVMCKNRISTEELVQRLQADGYIHVTDRTGVVYPEEQSAKLIYERGIENYEDIIKNSMNNYKSVVNTEAEAMVKVINEEKEKAAMNKRKKSEVNGRVMHGVLPGGGASWIMSPAPPGIPRGGKGGMKGRKRLRLR